MVEVELSPNLLFIQPDIWESDLGRDAALTLLLDYLDEIERLRVVSVLWSERMEELLWSDPPLPPWRVDRDWKLKLVPIIANKFRKLLKFVDVAVDCPLSGFEPPESFAAARADILEAFCRLSHQAASEEEELVICFDPSQDFQRPVSFQCESCAVDATVRSIQSPSNLGTEARISAAFWGAAEVQSSRDIDSLLALALRWQAGSCAARYRATYSPSFILDVARATDKRAIFEALAKRISKTEDEAKHDHGLHDEPVKGKAKGEIRRFRVSINERIHYSYSAAQEILFLNYYPEGHHDDGL